MEKEKFSRKTQGDRASELLLRGIKPTVLQKTEFEYLQKKLLTKRYPGQNYFLCFSDPKKTNLQLVQLLEVLFPVFETTLFNYSTALVI